MDGSDVLWQVLLAAKVHALHNLLLLVVARVWECQMGDHLGRQVGPGKGARLTSGHAQVPAAPLLYLVWDHHAK